MSRSWYGASTSVDVRYGERKGGGRRGGTAAGGLPLRLAGTGDAPSIHTRCLVEGDPRDTINDVVTATRAAMAEASRAVLDGVEVDTEVDLVRWPGRLLPERGRPMWERVMSSLETRNRVASLII